MVRGTKHLEIFGRIGAALGAVFDVVDLKVPLLITSRLRAATVAPVDRILDRRSALPKEGAFGFFDRIAAFQSFPDGFLQDFFERSPENILQTAKFFLQLQADSHT